MTKNCPQCGIEFYFAVRGGRSPKYCSAACYGLSCRRRTKCETCGKENLDSGRRFCGKECQTAAQITAVVRLCEVCGTKVYATPYRILTGRARFCSHECASFLNSVDGKIGWLRMTDEQQAAMIERAKANHWSLKGKFSFPRPSKSVRLACNSAISKALRRGELIRPDHCSECGIVCKPSAHHEDYSKPVDVMWLCQKCHSQRHFHGAAQ